MAVSQATRLLRRVLNAVSALPSGWFRWNHHPIALLDQWTHKMRAPRWIQGEICDVFDHWVGIDDDNDIPDDDYGLSERDCCD